MKNMIFSEYSMHSLSSFEMFFFELIKLENSST